MNSVEMTEAEKIFSMSDKTFYRPLNAISYEILLFRFYMHSENHIVCEEMYFFI